MNDPAKPPELDNVPVASPAAAPVAPPLPRQGFIRLSPINRRRWQNFKANRRGYWSFWIFLVLFVLCAVRRVHRQRPADRRLLQGRVAVPGLRRLSGGEVRRLPRQYRLPRSGHRQGDRGERLDASGRRSASPTTRINLDLPVPAPAPPTWMLKDEQCRAIAERTGGTGCRDIELELARHRRPGPRRRRAADLRLPHLGAVRAHPRRHLLGDRRRGGRGAGLFRRLDRSPVPALHRDLDLDPLALPAHHHLGRHHAELLRAARHPAAVLLGRAGRRGARRVPARPQLRIRPRRARARPVRRARSCSSTCCRTRWWRR